MNQDDDSYYYFNTLQYLAPAFFSGAYQASLSTCAAYSLLLEIVSLGLNSVAHHHGTFAGILCTGIMAGAVVPLIIGGLAE